MKNIAVVTGASSGMGREFVLRIDKKILNIDEIWIIARRKERLEELKKKVKTPCVIIDGDITTQEFCENYERMLSEKKPKVKMLINCAGYGLVGNMGVYERNMEIGIVKTNCTALTDIIYLTLPHMPKNGRIINLASSAAFFPQPGFAIYAASKAYVLSLSRALAMELAERKIYVTAVCPGPVDTEFFDIAEKSAQRAWYKNIFMSKATDVVKLALKDSYNKKQVSVYGISMKVLMAASKIIPDSAELRIVSLLNNKNKQKDLL